jgi:hypothetical protein
MICIIVSFVVFLYVSPQAQANRFEILEACEKIISSLDHGVSPSDLAVSIDQVSEQIDDYSQATTSTDPFLEYALDFYATSQSLLRQFKNKQKTHIVIQENNKSIHMGFGKKTTTDGEVPEKIIQFSESENRLTMTINAQSSQSIHLDADLYRQACLLLHDMNLFIDIRHPK